jgi:trigger factor
MSDFLLDLKWQLVKDKIAIANELKVENEEIQEGAYRRVYQYVGPYGDQETVQRIAGTILADREQVDRISREVMANKVFEVLKGSFDVLDEAISEEDFKVASEEILQPMKM